MFFEIKQKRELDGAQGELNLCFVRHDSLIIELDE